MTTDVRDPVSLIHLIDDRLPIEGPYTPPIGSIGFQWLTVAGVELTQATQYFAFNGQGSRAGPDNSVPLVEQKTLVLRVYVDFSSLVVPNATRQVVGGVSCHRVWFFPPGT